MYNDYMYIHDDFLLLHHLLGELHKDDLTKFLDSPWADCSKAIHQSRIPNLSSSTHFFTNIWHDFFFKREFRKKLWNRFVKISHESLTGLFTRPFRDDAWQVIGLISLACILMMGLPLTFIKARILYQTSKLTCRLFSRSGK